MCVCVFGFGFGLHAVLLVSFFACVFPCFCFVLCMSCTYAQLTFMWGNLGRASEETREVPVPLLLPGQVGVVSVTFVAPGLEGTYTSHWRLAHCGCQFGPRVWCSIVVEEGSGRGALGHQSKRRASLQKHQLLIIVGFAGKNVYARCDAATLHFLYIVRVYLCFNAVLRPKPVKLLNCISFIVKK